MCDSDTASMNIHNDRVLILGVGNPILGDDGVGWHIAGQVQQQLSLHPQLAQACEVDCVALGGLSLMERLVGYDSVILIDAFSSGESRIGEVHAFTLNEMEAVEPSQFTNVHDASLQQALSLGVALGVKLPAQIYVVAVKADVTTEFSEVLSQPIAASVPIAVAVVLHKLLAMIAEDQRSGVVTLLS